MQLSGQGVSANPHVMPEAQPAIADGVEYKVYDRHGNRSSLLAIVGAAEGAEVLLVGEEHDDMIGHAFETELFKAAVERLGPSDDSPGRPVVLSLEMFERDVQYVLDEYLHGLISEDHFLSSARPWDYYEGRYRPLIEAAREFGSPVIAANAPRRYVSRVTSEGPASLQSLSAVAQSYLPPLPYPGPSDLYRDQWNEVMAAAMAEMEAPDSAQAGLAEEGGEPSTDEPQGETEPSEGEDEAEQPHGYQMSPNAIYSQALWDASMGHAITNALVRRLGTLVVHFAGSFHVASGTGITERIEDYRPGTKVTTVVMTKVDDIDAWLADEHGDLADFVVLTKKPTPAATAGS